MGTIARLQQGCNRCWRCCRCCRRNNAFITPATSAAESFVSALEDTEDVHESHELEVQREQASKVVRKQLCEKMGSLAVETWEASKRARSAATVAGSRGPNEAPWRDCSTPGKASCFVKTARCDDGKVRSEVAIEVNTADHIDVMNLLEVSPEGVAGTIPVVVDSLRWLEWFPMMERVEVLHRWGPTEMLMRLEFKLPVVRIRLMFYIYLCFVNRLDEEDGCVELLICSDDGDMGRFAKGVAVELQAQSAAAPTADAEATFLGVKLPLAPKKGLVIKADLDFMSLRLLPVAPGVFQERCIILGEENCPLEWVTNQIWRTMSRNLNSIIAKRASEAPVQALSGEDLRFFAELGRQIDAVAAKRQAEARAHAQAQGQTQVQTQAPAQASVQLVETTSILTAAKGGQDSARSKASSRWSKRDDGAPLLSNTAPMQEP
eukprot:NODE_6018_length_1712_cov_5.537539.p1 GENE.NODE_6018_length_1712_cov_5.537539~~NODE_6018_length_1712_cov_5.537539.p1  ORF type:complete len:434 (+),score=118.60 NODE_6018_length_1712_cov_5.537539:126-1427(+)